MWREFTRGQQAAVATWQAATAALVASLGAFLFGLDIGGSDGSWTSRTFRGVPESWGPGAPTYGGCFSKLKIWGEHPKTSSDI